MESSGVWSRSHITASPCLRSGRSGTVLTVVPEMQFACEQCGSELTPEGFCSECGWDATPEAEDRQSLDSDYVIELPYGFRIDAQDEYVYHNIKLEAEMFEDAGDTYQHEDWAQIRDLLETKIAVAREQDPTAKRQLKRIELQQMTALGTTRRQRIESTGSSLSPIDIIRIEAEKAEKYLAEHSGEFDWQYECANPECGHRGMMRMNVPHPMFSMGDDGDEVVWCAELAPLIKRYYQVGKQRTNIKGARYNRRNWMDRNEWDGGLSVTDAARILNLSPVGMLWAIWCKSSESGDTRLPSMYDLVGFTFDLDSAESMRPFLPEGLWDSSEFIHELEEYQGLKKKVSRLRDWRAKHKELILWWVIANRLQFMDFFGPRIAKEGRWKTWYSQKPSTCDDTSLERDGRGTGKSERVKMCALQAALSLSVEYPGSSVLVATPDEQHTREHYENCLLALEQDTFFRACLAPGRERKMSRQGGLLRLVGNACTIYFRYPGTNTKDAFALQQYHVSALVVDEVGKWPHAAEKAVGSSVKRQQCVCMKYFGVIIHESPTMPIYYYSRWPDKHSKFKGHVYSMPSMINVYDYNLKMHRELIETLGGTFRSDEFMRQVMGVLGDPSETEFSPEELKKVCVLYSRLRDDKSPYRRLEITRRMLGDNQEKEVGARLRGDMPNRDLMQDSRDCLFGFDYGTKAPSQLWVLVRLPGSGRWRLSYRVEMRGISDDSQVDVVHYLACEYNPYLIAMDMTGVHNRVAGIMTSEHAERLSQHGYRERIWPVSSSANLDVKYYNEKPGNPSIKVQSRGESGNRYWAEVQNTKQWGMSRIHYWFQRELIELPAYDEGLITEFSKLTVKDGKWTGVDHNVAAMLSFVVCHWQNYELKTPELEEDDDSVGQTFAPVSFDVGALYSGSPLTFSFG